MELIDTHAHLMEPRLFSQLEELLTRAVGAGVSQVVVVGTTLADSVAGVAACRGRVGLFPTAGIHPNHVAESEAGDWDSLEALARCGQVVAMGETGLDRHWDRTPFPEQQAMAFLELGLHLSFAGMLTFKNPSLNPLRATAARVPGNRILVETDSPYLSPHPFRGRTNEPARAVETLQVLADVRGVPVEELAGVTTANARALFRLPSADRLAVGEMAS